MFSLPLFRHSAAGFCLCVHWCIYFTTLKVPYLYLPLPPSPPPSSSALRCVIYESACWPVNVSPSILCSTPSEVIRLWRAIYRPLKAKAPIFPLLFLLPYNHYIWTFVSRSAEVGNVSWVRIDLDNIAVRYKEQQWQEKYCWEWSCCWASCLSLSQVLC